MRTGRRGVAVAVALGAGIVVGGAGPRETAAQQWTWPERAENLTELPADFPPERLSAVMRGFTEALGVRCSHCHVGEEGRPLSTFDFVSDANPNKERARAMYRMLGLVNEQLRDIEPSGDERVNLWCHTCHAGKPRPLTLAEAVGERYRAEGGAAAWAYFVELRDRYFGAAAYDFTARSVDAIGASFVEREDTAAAYPFLEDNVARWPEDGQAHESMAGVWLTRGDTTRAIGHLERSLALEPANPRARATLDRLRGG